MYSTRSRTLRLRWCCGLCSFILSPVVLSDWYHMDTSGSTDVCIGRRDVRAFVRDRKRFFSHVYSIYIYWYKVQGRASRKCLSIRVLYHPFYQQLQQLHRVVRTTNNIINKYILSLSPPVGLTISHYIRNEQSYPPYSPHTHTPHKHTQFHRHQHPNVANGDWIIRVTLQIPILP